MTARTAEKPLLMQNRIKVVTGMLGNTEIEDEKDTENGRRLRASDEKTDRGKIERKAEKRERWEKK